MPTEQGIKAKYKELHGLLSESYYNFHNITKEEFDTQHGQIWIDMEAELIANGFIKLPEPARDPLTEIDELKEEIVKLKASK